MMMGLRLVRCGNRLINLNAVVSIDIVADEAGKFKIMVYMTNKEFSAGDFKTLPQAETGLEELVSDWKAQVKHDLNEKHLI